MFNIVLVKPQIPQNTGNIARLSVCNDCLLHLIKPLGFSLEDKYIKRSGMDYWHKAKIKVYNDWNQFLTIHKDIELNFLSTKANTSIFNKTFKKNDFLIFGNESNGLPSDFYTKYIKNMYYIPMISKNSRSLNLANSVSICLYEAIRQNI